MSGVSLQALAGGVLRRAAGMPGLSNGLQQRNPKDLAYGELRHFALLELHRTLTHGASAILPRDLMVDSSVLAVRNVPMTQPLTWTEEQVRQIVQHPDQLLAEAPWRDLISAAGGLDAFYLHLQSFPLNDKQQQVLTTMLTYPGASVDTYCSLLHIHPATFHRHQRTLFRKLVTFLNSVPPTGAAPPHPPATARSLRALHQLPASVADFIGRDSETASLVQAIRDGASIAGISGMGGVGKTELAVRVARLLLDQFPDAQIMLALHGTREASLTPAHVLQSIIRLFDRDEHLPNEIEPLQQLYRSCLYGKRVLILADDARDAEHVRALTAPAGSLLLITSRQHFLLPGMSAIHLEVLPVNEAQALLQRICRRVTMAEAATIAATGGYLPLAIRASGSILRNTPALPITRYIQRLTDTRQRLAVLRDPEDPQLDVEASLELSYASLDAIAQQVLRQVSVLVSDFPLSLGLATVGLATAEQAEDVFYQLLRRNLLMYDSVGDRWHVHDLVRMLALKKATAQDDITASQWRYARAVIALIHDLRAPYLRGGDETRRSIRRFDQERPHVEAVWRWATAHMDTPDSDRLLVDFILVIQGLAHLRYDFKRELHPLFTAGIAAAERLGDRSAEGTIQWRQGMLAMSTGDLDAAVTAFHRAIAHIQAVGDALTLAHIQADLAAISVYRGGRENYQQAIVLYEQVMDAYARYGAEGTQECICINNMGIAYSRLENYPQALACYEKALMIATRTGVLTDQCRALANLGDIAIMMKHPHTAIPYCQQGLALASELQYRQAEGIITGYLAKAYALAGDWPQADQAFTHASSILREINDRWSEADLQWQYGMFVLEQGDRERALRLLRASLEYKQEIGAGTLAQDAAVLAQLEAAEPKVDYR